MPKPEQKKSKQNKESAAPDIPLPQLGPLIHRVIRVEEGMKKSEKRDKFTQTLIIGVVIVLFISLLGFVFDAFLYRTDAYKSFQSTVKEFNNSCNPDEIEKIKKELQFVKKNLEK